MRAVPHGMTTSAKTEYRCLIGFDYQPRKGANQRFEPGDVVDGIPAKTRDELAEAHVVEAVAAKKAAA